MKIFNRQGRGLTLLLAAVAAVCVSGCGGRVSERSDNSQNGATQTTTNTATNQAAASETAAPAPTAPKPKAAVYIMGNPEGRDALRMAVNTFLVKSDRYQMIAVDAIDIVAKEHQRQMSGSVSDEQIAKLGQDAGAQYVCVVERTELDGYSYVATRMVSVESKVAEFADMVKLPHGGDIIEFIKWQIGSMLGMDVGPRPTFTQQQAATSQPVATTPQPTAATPQTIAAAPQQAAQQSRVDANSTFTDSRDGKQYRTVVIGGKRWMAENLNYRVKENSWCYNEDNSYCDKYGRLYDWKTATTVCPAGFHLPSRDEWDDLVDAAGGKGVAGKRLKAKSGWIDNGNGTDNFGFSALPGGAKSFTLRLDAGSGGVWWMATKDRAGQVYRRYIDSTIDYVGEYGDNIGIGDGYSVRCVQE